MLMRVTHGMRDRKKSKKIKPTKLVKPKAKKVATV